MKPIRVLIVDDEKLFADSLKIVLDASRGEGISVVGTAGDGAAAVALTRDLRPDVILMDVHMPGIDGVEATRTIHREMPDARIVMLTTFHDDVYVQSAIGNGARGYILKDIEVAELIAAIRAVHAGSFLVSPSVGSRLASARAAADPGPARRVRSLLEAFPDLTRREAEVLLLVVDSYDNHEIAEKLAIGGQTVRNYTSAIYAKLGVRDRIHAIRLVQERARIGPASRES